jgi:hypothetical protein
VTGSRFLSRDFLTTPRIDLAAAQRARRKVNQVPLQAIARIVPRHNSSSSQVFDLSATSGHNRGSMITLVLHLFRPFPFLVGGHRQLALDNLALRQQLALYKRTAPRPRLGTMNRLFWIGLARVWTGWRQALVIVSPDTVLRWQRRRFREYWTQLCGRPTRGRPCINAEVAALVRKMAAANPLWGAPRIHGELLKLRCRCRRAHRLPPHAETASPTVTDLANVPHQPCPGLGFDRFLHRAHRALAAWARWCCN